MKWTPSIIQTVAPLDGERPQKTSAIDWSSLDTVIKTLPNIENIFAGSLQQRKVLSRPVMLVETRKGDLMHGEDLGLGNMQSFLDKKCIVQVSLRASAYTHAELSLAIKDSIQAEKQTIQKLEAFQQISPEGIYITVEGADFFITKSRLLGEILTAQRKLERLKATCTLGVCSVLESFIKKLCIIKVLAEKEIANKHYWSMPKE
ncbi:hypothetical protein NECID01_0849 [Nematocida sp. AWRm77]|nr:hypothetical protein NECID01_0849 [Nematocida sp. AWRm77]